MSARRTHDTRRALVDEGIRALLELTPAALLSAVGVKDIASRAGVRPTTLYHHFGSLDGYADAVVAQVFAPGEFGVGAITDQLEGVRAAALPVEVGRAMHRAEFARVLEDPELRVRLGLWALGGTAMDQAYGDLLRIVDARIARTAVELFEDWGRELSPPFDEEAFVAAHSALLSGAVVRHLVDPEGLDVERFSRTAQALTMVMLRVRGDRRSLDDRLAEINYYPLHSAKGAPLTDHRQRTRGRVLHAAAELFGRDGLGGVTVAGIARAASTSPSTVYGLFNGVDDIAVHLLLRQAQDVLARRPPAAAAGLELVADRLGVVAEIVAARAAYAAPYAGRLMTATTPADDVLMATVRGSLEAARATGHLAEPADPESTARTLMLVVFGRLFSHRAEGHEAAVRHATGLVFPGLAAR